MGKLTLAAMLLASVAGTASAQSFAHKGTDFTIGYDSWSVTSAFGPGGFDGATTLARVRTDWGFGSSYGMQVNADFARFTIDGSSGEGDVSTFALHPYYEGAGSFRAGVYYQRSNIQDGAAQISYYGLEGMFTPTENLSWEFYVGTGDIDSSSVELIGYGTTVSYAMNERMAFHLAYDREEISQGSSDFSNSRFNIGFDYSLPSNGSMPPVVLTAEVGTVDIFSIINLDVIGAKVTIPLGGTAGATGRKLYRERGIYWAVGGIAF